MAATMRIVSYDVREMDWKVRGKVNRLVFGAVCRKRVGDRVVEYRYPGVLDRPAARWLGQSVLLLRPADAEEVEAALRGLGVGCDGLRVTVGE